MRFLLDTNVWIEILKNRNIILLDRFSLANRAELVTCSVVRAELMHGAEKYQNAIRRRAEVQELVSSVISLPYDDHCANVYAQIRQDLEIRGCVIGPFDLQIAAIALVHDLTLVTSNTREFSRVHGLRIEDWSLPVV